MKNRLKTALFVLVVALMIVYAFVRSFTPLWVDVLFIAFAVIIVVVAAWVLPRQKSTPDEPR